MNSERLRLSMSNQYGKRSSAPTHGVRVNHTRWFLVRSGLWTRVIVNKIYVAEREGKQWSLTVISTDVDVRKSWTLHKNFKEIREEVSGIQINLFDK